MFVQTPSRSFPDSVFDKVVEAWKASYLRKHNINTDMSIAVDP